LQIPDASFEKEWLTIHPAIDGRNQVDVNLFWDCAVVATPWAS
jgi:hypothetical protein